MITLNLNDPLQDLDGNPIPDTNAGKLLAMQLASTPHGNIVKHYDWAMAFHHGKEVSVDAADLDYLRKFVENNQQLSILAKQQMLSMMAAKPG